MKDCIFCKIVRREIPKEFAYEDKDIVAFEDLHPKTPVHLLVVPKKHVEDFFHSDAKTVEDITRGIKHLIDKEKLMGRGYTLEVNGGGFQIISHLHFHLMGPKGVYKPLDH